MGEKIVLLDETGHATGTAPKAESHHGQTPFHLAFSTYLVNDQGKILITQRAHHKASFPSVRTNSCCGHPAPGESLREAVTRRVKTEHGLEITDLTLLLPGFVYRAEMNGVVEHEWCPVVRARVTGEPLKNPDEVEDAVWMTWEEVQALVHDPLASPWFIQQMQSLAPMGEPEKWPHADISHLPPAIAW
jgi:isopentenyl-diphosphate delta-isomerase